MKSQEAALRLHRFEVEDHRQKVSDLEMMINDFKAMAHDLAIQIDTEEKRAGVTDVAHYAYPTFAKAALQRRENLLASAGDLEAKLAVAKADLEEAENELKTVELKEEREMDRNNTRSHSGESSDDHANAQDTAPGA